MPSATPVLAIPYTLGGDDIKQGDDTIAALAQRVEALLIGRSNRNVIRNGDMGVAQRGPGGFSGNVVYGLDGWIQYGSGGVVSVVRQSLGTSFPPFAYFLGAQMTTPCSTAASYALIEQRIEDVRTFSGQQVTLSFWAGGSVAGRTVGLSIRQNHGSGGSFTPYLNTTIGKQLLTGSLTRYSFTFTVPSVAGKTLGTTSPDDSWLGLRFWLGVGSDNLAESGLAAGEGTQAAWNLNITGVQLELGPVATPFEKLPHQQQLAWCQRYFYRCVNAGAGNLYVGTGIAWSGGNLYTPVTLPVPMRTPNATYGVSAALGFLGTANGTVTGSAGTAIQGTVMTITATGSFAAGSAYILWLGPGVYFDVTAEL